MRTKLQFMIGGLSDAPPALGSARRVAAVGQGITCDGSYPELQLKVEELGWKGVADLVVVQAGECHIIDFKTGQPSADHPTQVRIYALLWSRDRQTNPDGLGVTRLAVRYATHDVSVPVPTAAEMAELERELTQRGAVAKQLVAVRPPEARPAPDVCRWCEVRHLCDPYWAAGSLCSDRQGKSWIGDCEVEVTLRASAFAYRVRVDRSSWPSITEEAWLRGTRDSEALSGGVPEGKRLRMLNVRLEEGRDGEAPTLWVGEGSEVYFA